MNTELGLEVFEDVVGVGHGEVGDSAHQDEAEDCSGEDRGEDFHSFSQSRAS